jgi:hypothetical protein
VAEMLGYSPIYFSRFTILLRPVETILRTGEWEIKKNDE